MRRERMVGPGWSSAALLAGVLLLAGATAAAHLDWWETEYDGSPRDPAQGSSGRQSGGAGAAAYAANFDDFDAGVRVRVDDDDDEVEGFRVWGYGTGDDAYRTRNDVGWDEWRRGRVVAFEGLTTAAGRPLGLRVMVQNDRGATRTVTIGEDYWRRGAEEIRLGQRVRVQGNFIRENGRTLLHASDVVPAGTRFRTAVTRDFDAGLHGRLVDIRLAKVDGTRVQAVIAALETEDGQVRPVLIGSRRALGRHADSLVDGALVNLGTRAGYTQSEPAEFIVTGIYVDEPGYTVQAAPRTYIAEPPRTYIAERPRTYVTERWTTGGSSYVTGEVGRLDERDVNGREHYIADLEVGDDHYIRVDLGPKDGLDDLDIESGDEIRVQGFRGTLHGESMLLATFVEGDDGETATISRDRFGNIRDIWVHDDD